MALALALVSKVLSSNTSLCPGYAASKSEQASKNSFHKSADVRQQHCDSPGVRLVYPVFGSFAPDKAVDGNRDAGSALRMSSSCFVSKMDNNPWWTVKPPETSKSRGRTGLQSKILVSVFVSRVWSHSSSSSSSISSSSSNNCCSSRRRTRRQRRSSSSDEVVSISVT